MTTRFTPRSLSAALAALAVAVILSGTAAAEIVIGDLDDWSPVPPRPLVRQPPLSPGLDLELQTGGMPIRIGNGAPLFPFIGPRFAPYPVARASAGGDSTRTAARRAVNRAHAFSSNLYREIHKDEPLPWYSYYGIYGSW